MPEKENEGGALPPWAREVIALERPLAVFDLETTGTIPHMDRIVEIGVVKILPDGGIETRSRRVNPGIPIPPGATAVHGIRDQDVAGEAFFHQIAAGLLEFLAGCDLAGFNMVKFDLPLLRREFERAGLEFPIAGRRLIDAQRIFHLMEPRDLTAAHLFYCNEPITDAHSAAADARATYRVLLGQLRRYPSLPHSMESLHRLCNPVDNVDEDGKLQWQEDEAVFTFGKHRGRSLRAVVAEDRDYLQYLLGSDFPPELKRIVTAALQGLLPRRGMPNPQAAGEGNVVQTRLAFPGSDPPGGPGRAG